MKKKMICWMLLMTVAALLPALAMAEGAAGAAASAPAIDWTALVVAVIGVIGTAASALLGRVWVKYVKPWLAQRDLTDNYCLDSCNVLANLFNAACIL